MAYTIRYNGNDKISKGDSLGCAHMSIHSHHCGLNRPLVSPLEMPTICHDISSFLAVVTFGTLRQILVRFWTKTRASWWVLSAWVGSVLLG